MIKINGRGDFKKTMSFITEVNDKIKKVDLNRFGQQGVIALSNATPIESGKTHKSWYYKIEQKNNRSSISFLNSNVNNGVPIAIILQYGHGTRNGGWVEGRDYINPAIQPIFDIIVEEAWKEVTNT